MSDMLLQHPKPFKNDSLADYLFHLSQKNYCDFMWILAPYETSREKIYEKLNTCANEVLLLHISELTCVS